MRCVRPFYYLALTLTSVVSACGDGGGHPAPAVDAGSSARRLEIQAPPGDQLGLAFFETRSLRVRYLDADEAPIGDADVTFELVIAAGSDPAGAVLSAARATTDADGIASVDVTGGALVTGFRVRASALNASPAEFFVAVSDGGFTSLRARLVDRGGRPAAHFASVHARLYAGAEAACAMLDAAAPPDSSFPTRSVAFGDEAVYPQLPANQAYTLLAWGESATGLVLAAGCVELAAAQVIAGGELRLELPVDDRPVRLAGRYALELLVNLSSLSKHLLDHTDGWGAGGCALGAAQLVLDCAIDALDAGDPADCLVVAPGPNAAALEAVRAPAGVDGCRPATLPGGAASLDALVQDALTGSGAGTRFTMRAQTLSALLAGLALDSALDVGAATHTLARARFVLLTGDVTIDVAASARPIVVAHDVAISLGAGATPTLSLGKHGFTLRLGSLLHDAFVVLDMVPDDGRFGRELVAGTAGPSGSSGCAALSQVACPPAGLAASCLVSACNDSLTALDALLARPFVLSDGSDVDFHIESCSATGVDVEPDLIAEALGTGLCSATLTLADATTLQISSTFTGVALAP